MILFLYKDGISYPLWMNYFFNEASRESLAISHLIAHACREQIFKGVAFWAQPVGVHSNYARSVP
jgi:hypothetical protein